MDRQQYERMTATEMLEYYKNEVFAKMGIEIEGLQNRDADYQEDQRDRSLIFFSKKYNGGTVLLL